MTSKGAATASPSQDSAILVPEPCMINAIELPLVRPPRVTISWTTDARFGVLCFAFETVQEGPLFQATEAVVLLLEEVLCVDDGKAVALSDACDRKVSEEEGVDASSTANPR